MCCDDADRASAVTAGVVGSEVSYVVPILNKCSVSVNKELSAAGGDPSTLPV